MVRDLKLQRSMVDTDALFGQGGICSIVLQGLRGELFPHTTIIT